MDPATEVLIAELHRQGLLDGPAIANMAERLDRIGERDAADRVRGIPLSNKLDDPAEVRAVLTLVPRDGGNRPD